MIRLFIDYDGRCCIQHDMDFISGARLVIPLGRVQKARHIFSFLLLTSLAAHSLTQSLTHTLDQVSFKDVSWSFQSSFKLLSKFFKSSFKVFSKNYQNSSNFFQRFFQSSFISLWKFFQSVFKISIKFFQRILKTLQGCFKDLLIVIFKYCDQLSMRDFWLVHQNLLYSIDLTKKPIFLNWLTENLLS